ncbi:MAG TPA: filamentous hemagglutinin N-terminal domain-containing protein [Bradyrhizobium sp.]|nr:filamentous hemagglutinin N-terminal domain-containing protein [Bradyrhizobium sp.]
MTVNQSSSRAIVDWNSFSVGPNASVNFVQPNAGAAILNRVTGTTSSTIAGQVTANGQVFLVNPNGIAITPSGSVQVGGGFVASTLDIANGDFNAGKLNFTGKGASSAVSNSGSIAAAPGSFVGLIGGSVASNGTIRVPLGKVGLGSGERITLNPSGDGFMQVAVPTGATTADGQALVDIAGRVSARGGAIEIKAATARDAVRDVVNVSGLVTARTVSGRRGNIVLDGGEGGTVTISGRLAADGGRASKGGTVVVTGNKVKLTSTARISASGTQGGTVLIGGDLHGGIDPATKLVKVPVRTAQQTLIAPGATISANGTSSGGGNVVVWSDGFTDFRGSISSTGSGAGSGGAVEVSSHGVLGFKGSVDVTAKSGTTGTLLLDPYDVTISTGADSNYDASFTATGNSSVINTTTLQNALASANVTVSTGSSGTQNGDITVANALTWASGNSLALNAAGAVNVNAPITATNGSLSMTGTTISVNSTAITLGGTLTASAPASGAANAVMLNNAAISVGNGASTISGGSSSGGSAGVLITGSGSLSNSGSGSLSLTGTNTSGYGVQLGSSATLTTSGSVALAGTSASSDGLYFSGASTVTDTSGNLTLSGSSSSGTGLSANGNLGLTNSGAGTLALNGTVTTSSGFSGINFGTGVNLTTSGAVTLSGSSVSNSGLSFAGTNSVTDTAGNLALSGSSAANTGLWVNGNLGLTDSGAGTLALNGTVTTSSGLSGIGFGTGVNLTTSGAVTVSGSSVNSSGVFFAGTNSVTDSGGNLALSGSSSANTAVWVGGNLALTNSGAGTLALNGTGTTSSGLSGIGFGTGVNLTTSGAVTVSGSSVNSSGVFFAGTNSVADTGGNLALSGSSSANSAVYVGGNLGLANSGAGTLAINGTVTSSSGYAGIDAATGVSITTSGAVTLTGTSISNAGIYFSGANSVTNSAGDLALSGTSTSSSGVGFAGNTSLSNAGASLTVAGSSTSGPGAYLAPGVVVTTSGPITMSGTSASDSGVSLDSSAGIADSSGNLAVTGASTSRLGVSLAAGTNTLSNSGAGSFSLSGTSGSYYGVGIDANLASSGNVSISGTGSATGLYFNGSTITDNSGNLTISGTGPSNGIWLNAGTTALVNNGAGLLQVNGASPGRRGIRFNTGTALTSSGTVDLSGTSTTDVGFSFKGSNSITVNSGALTIAGATSSGSAGIDTSSSGNTITNNGGVLTLQGTGGDKIGATITSNAAPLVINDSGAVTQSAGSITTPGLLLSGGSSYALTGANMIGTLAASGVGALTFNNAQNLAVGTVQGTSGVSASSNVTLVSSGNLTIAPGAPVSGASLALAAAGAFINNNGSGAVTAASGRWLIYSSAPGADSFGGLNSADTAIWNATYATLPPGSVTAGGNRYLFATQPTLTFTSTSAPARTYGTDATAAIASNYVVSGYQSGIAGAFLGDNAGSTFAGSPSVTSSGAPGTAGVTGSPYTINVAQGSLLATSGYALVFNNAGRLTVNPAPVMVTALGGASTYGTSPGNPGLSATGLQNGESVSVLTGLSNSFGITGSTKVGNYALSVTGTLSNPNYALVGTSPGSWSVTPLRTSITDLPSPSGVITKRSPSSPSDVALSGIANAADMVNVALTPGTAAGGRDSPAGPGSSSNPAKRSSPASSPPFAPQSEAPPATPPPVMAAPSTEAPVPAATSRPVAGVGCGNGSGTDAIAFGSSPGGSAEGCAPPSVAGKLASHVVDFALQRLNRDALGRAIEREFGETVRSAGGRRKVMMVSFAATSIALTAGLIGWLLRGGSLVAALLSSIPLWSGFDPLVIVTQPRRSKTSGRGMSELDSMFDGAQPAHPPPGTPR